MKKQLSIGAVLTIAVFSLHASYLVDNSETGTNTNTLGGIWGTYSDGYSSIAFVPNAAPGQSGDYCRNLSWTINAGASAQYAGASATLNASWSGVNLSAYKGVRFYAKGYGLYEITLATAQTSTENNHYAKKVHVNQEWTLYELPFSQFAQTWGTPKPWDPTTIYSAGFTVISGAGISGQLWIDNIEFYLASEEHPVPDPNIKIYEPKINQEGYLIGEKKYFTITADSVSAGDAFQILNATGNEVYSGTITNTPINDIASTGEYVWKVDFSSFNTPGSYKVKVKNRVSYSFYISDSVYNKLFRDALRCFYMIRCGLAENDPVSGINRPACHTALAQIRGKASTMDASGGWHNAGDMGLFVHETAISIANMLWLYDLKTSAMQNIKVSIPESSNAMSDLLDEAKWGLTWLLKMQNSDGTVYHKADGEPNLSGCYAPDQDPHGHIVSYQKDGTPQNPSTVDAADFAAVMSQAARVFTGIDNTFASTCLTAAQKAWIWVKANPNVGQTDPYYSDPSSWQEYLWAEGEMARTLNNNTLRTEFNSIMDTTNVEFIGWQTPQLFGYITLYHDPNTSNTLKNLIKSKILTVANTYVTTTNSTGYNVALQSWEYWWESNEVVLSRGNLLLFAYEISGSSVYRDAALSQLHYILGLNSLDKSFAMMHGTNYMEHPFNWIYIIYNKAIPGWLAGGPNSYGGDVLLQEVINKGTPKAKCYYDIAECSLGSWACNEGETSENAALVFLSGFFYKGDSPSGILESNKSKTNINVYPTLCSTASGFSNITFDGVPENSIIHIYNIYGEKITQIHTNSEKTVWNIADNSQIQDGIYVFSILNSNKNIYHGKLIILEHN